MLTLHIGSLRDAFRKVRATRPFHMDAIVIPSDHLYCIWTLPDDDADFSTRWRLIKSAVARSIEPGERRSDRRIRKRERGIWQRRFWEHLIRDEADDARPMDYIHYNPVKHGWVRRVVDWPHSSFHRLVRAEVYLPEWGSSETVRALDWE